MVPADAALRSVSREELAQVARPLACCVPGGLTALRGGRSSLFCSDLLHENDDVEPLTNHDVVGRTRQMYLDYEASV